MSVEIYFASGDEPLLAKPSYSKEALALLLSGAGEREHNEGRVGNYQRVTLDNGYEVLVNPMAVAYLRAV